MKKIFLFATPTGRSSYGVIRDAEITGDVVGYALSEDGRCITSHWSSGINWAKHDMGLTSDWKHEVYKEKYPDVYELEWINNEDLDTHKEFQKAYKLNQKMKTQTENV